MKRHVGGAAVLIFTMMAATATAGTCDPKKVVGSTHKVTAAEAHVNPRTSDKVTGTLATGVEADVISTRDVEGQTWYLVRWPDGGTKKAGWIEGSHLICD